VLSRNRTTTRPPVFWWMLSFFFAITLYSIPINAGQGWIEVADGIQYKKEVIFKMDFEKPPHGILHLFTIDPAKYRLDIITAKKLGMVNTDARTMAKRSGAILAINGGFFSPEFDSLGLLVSNGRELNKMKKISWWHVFKTEKGAPSVIARDEYKASPDVEMAVEAGPRVLIGGIPAPKLKPSPAERTVIGTDKNGRIVIAVTERLSLTLMDLARYLRADGFTDILNLDGGSSTQLYAKFKGLEIDRQGLGLVANGVGVFPR